MVTGRARARLLLARETGHRLWPRVPRAPGSCMAVRKHNQQRVTGRAKPLGNPQGKASSVPGAKKMGDKQKCWFCYVPAAPFAVTLLWM